MTKRERILARLERGLERVKAGWFQGKNFNAIDAEGNEAFPHCGDASAWSTCGAVSGVDHFGQVIDVKSAVAELGITVSAYHPGLGGSAYQFNEKEGQTHQAVIELFEKTIERVKKEIASE